MKPVPFKDVCSSLAQVMCFGVRDIQSRYLRYVNQFILHFASISFRSASCAAITSPQDLSFHVGPHHGGIIGFPESNIQEMQQFRGLQLHVLHLDDPLAVWSFAFRQVPEERGYGDNIVVLMALRASEMQCCVSKGEEIISLRFII